MLVGSRHIVSLNSKAIEAFNVASQYFLKNTVLLVHQLAVCLEEINGLYVVNIGYENWTHFGEVDDKISQR